jgi:hypothetical protein
MIYNAINYFIIYNMNTYPTTPEQLFMEQKFRDDNNPGCIDHRRSEAIRRKYKPLSFDQEKLREEATKKWEEDVKSGFASKRYDYPEYLWWMIQDGNKYFRSSCNFNVYDYEKCSVIVGTWNEQTQRIEFTYDLSKRVKEIVFTTKVE